MELIIGSNRIINTSGVLRVQGKDQIFLEIGKIDNQLLLTMEIYNVSKKLIGKLVKNAWAFNDKNRFEITTQPISLKLIDKHKNEVIVEAKVIAKDLIEVSNGTFYTHNGNLLEIRPQYWKIMGITMSNNVFDSCGGVVAIG